MNSGFVFPQIQARLDFCERAKQATLERETGIKVGTFYVRLILDCS